MTKEDNRVKNLIADAEEETSAELFLDMWAAGKRLSEDDRGDFIAGWIGWHSGERFDRECQERDEVLLLRWLLAEQTWQKQELADLYLDARKGVEQQSEWLFDLRAAVARVEALAAKWADIDSSMATRDMVLALNIAEDIRRALRGEQS